MTVIAWLLALFSCQHRAVLYDRVNGVACWRCAGCGLVKERR